MTKLIAMTVSKTRPRVSNWNNREQLFSSRNRFLPRPDVALIRPNWNGIITDKLWR